MKLQCQVEVINRLQNGSVHGPRGKYLKSTLALGKEPKKENEFFILHFSTVNKTGIKYNVKHIQQVFTKFLNEGKTTLRFKEPPHDLCIKCESIQLKCFMKLLQKCVAGDTQALQSCSNLSSISVTAMDVAPTKLTIKDRSEFPSKGLPRTLESLTLAGLRLCNFRRDVLMLKVLSVLDLSNNEIEKLPPELGRMPCLSQLNVANNKLGGKDNIDWRWLMGEQISKSLRLLNISGNQLNNLPKSIWKLRHLVTLNIDNNELEKLPVALGRISTLRYLTVSNNKLSALPCSLMHCQLDHIDISSNNFSKSEWRNRCKHFLNWDIYVGSLVQVAAKALLKNKIFYAPNLIPWTLVEFLDNSYMCVCGNPVSNNLVMTDLNYDPKEYFRTVVATGDCSFSVNFECYFCSFNCYRKYLFAYFQNALQ